MKFSTGLQLVATILLIGSLATPIQAESPRFEIEAGASLPTEKGLYYERGDEGYLNVRIEDDHFTVVFLDSDKLVVAPENVEEVLLMAESVRGEDNRENYLLHPTANGLAYTHPRYIQKPYLFRVKVRVSKSRTLPTPSTASGFRQEEGVEEYGFNILNQ